MLFYTINSSSQFIALNGERVLQSSLSITTYDSDKYIVGFSGVELPTIYFVVPGTNETWANGLDNQNCVGNCIALFDSETKAHERANDFVTNSKYQHAHFFKSKYHEQDQSLELVLVNTSSKEVL